MLLIENDPDTTRTPEAPDDATTFVYPENPSPQRGWGPRADADYLGTAINIVRW